MHLLASWAEETTFSPFSSISSSRLEYLDNLLMVASGIFLYFNFVTPFTSFEKKILNSHLFVKYIFMSRFAPYFQADPLLFLRFPFRYFSLPSGYLFGGFIQPPISNSQ